MSGMIFGRTQNAWQTPFEPDRNPGVGGVPSGISSMTVQEAIEEAKNDALNNDRYPIECSYNGNANVGRFLEIFPGQGSDFAPLVAPEVSRIVTYSFGAQSIATGVIAIKNNTTNIDLVLINFNGNTRITVTDVFIGGINHLDELSIYVKSGSFNKPFGRFWMNTAT